MKRSGKCFSLLLALLCLLSAFAGCAAKSEAAMDTATGGSLMYENAAEAPAAAPTEVETQAGLADSMSQSESGVLDAEKIIYTAYADVETLDFDATLTALDAMVAEYGAFVQSSSVTGSDYYSESRGHTVNRTAEYVLRVPKAHFSTLMSTLSTLGNVPYSHVDTENITTQYVDTEARLEACRIQQARLLELLEQAETVEDMLTIEGYLADVRYQIESLTSTLQNWDARIDYSTVTLSIREVQIYTEEPQVQLTYWQKIGAGLKRTLRNIGSFFRELLRIVIVYLPVFVLIAVAAVVVLLVARRIRRRRIARRAEREKSLERDK